MIVEIPYIYKADVLRHRARKAEIAKYRGSTVVDIREFTKDEAPVALRFQDPRDPYDEAPPLEVRWTDSRLWRPCPSDDPETPLGADEFIERLANLRRVEPFEIRHLFSGKETTRNEDRNIREFITSDEDAIVDQIRDRAKDVIFIDGNVWTATPEPFLVLHVSPRFRGQNGESHYATIEIDSRRGGHSPAVLYRFDEVDALPETTRVPAFEILIPECLTSRFTEAAIRVRGRQLYNSMVENLEFADFEYFKAFVALREALRIHDEAQEILENADIEALVEAIEVGLAVQDSNPEKKLPIVADVEHTLRRYRICRSEPELDIHAL